MINYEWLKFESLHNYCAQLFFQNSKSPEFQTVSILILYQNHVHFVNTLNFSGSAYKIVSIYKL